MKNRIIMISIATIVIVIIIFGITISQARRQYNANVEMLILQDSYPILVGLLDEFYSDNGEYPLFVKDPPDYSAERDTLTNYKGSDNIQWYWNEDHLSKSRNCYLKYYPLYNRMTGKRESFIVLSAGIDGKLNNVFSRTDSLFIDDWWRHVKVDNFEVFFANHYINQALKTIETDSVVYYDYTTMYPKFSLWKYLFSDADYLIMLDTLVYK